MKRAVAVPLAGAAALAIAPEVKAEAARRIVVSLRDAEGRWHDLDGCFVDEDVFSVGPLDTRDGLRLKLEPAPPIYFTPEQ